MNGETNPNTSRTRPKHFEGKKSHRRYFVVLVAIRIYPYVALSTVFKIIDGDGLILTKKKA